MIYVEGVMSGIVNLIPADSEGFKPVYHYGEGKELNAFLIGKQKEGKAAYPLVYQTSYRSNFNRIRNEVETQWEAVLATATKTEVYNTQREATTYKNVLYPLLENLEWVMRNSNAIRSNYEWDVELWPNYSETKRMDKHGFVDVVDALVIRTNLIITNDCINNKILWQLN